MHSAVTLLFCLIMLGLSGCASVGIFPPGPDGDATVDVVPREIRITGIITQATANRVLGELGRQTGDTITLRLDSPGGDVSAALQIHDWLRESDRTVVTSVPDGAKCMSSCTLIFTAGDRRVAGPTARFRFHAPRYVGGVPLPGPLVTLIEDMTRRGIANNYSTVAPQLARYLAEPGIRALDSRRGLMITGADLAARGDGFITELGHAN